MSANEMYLDEISNRYIYAVTKRLPRSQREDIKRELRSLIDDLLAERCQGNEPTAKEIDEVLMGLGAPEKLAAQYTQHPQYLIGPELFETYRYIMVLVLICVAFGMTIAHGILAFLSPQESTLVMFGNYIFSVYMAIINAFAFTTIAFVISDYLSKRNNNKTKEMWYPNMLPQLPEAAKGIKRSEPIVAIVFHIVGIILLNAVPWLFGAIFFYDDTLRIVPVFNLEYLKTVVIWFNICTALGIIRETAKLLIGRYTIPLSIIVSLLNVASLAIIVPVLKTPQIWNHNFIQNITATRIGADIAVLSTFWGTVTGCFYLVLIFAFIVDTVTIVVNTIKAQRDSF